ncbi:hypothetical protein [Pinibacter aurantiacus]|uniref:Uncharacterized protein n=1 Tax=Pinibacter aurantiacus TaxID=2851599 RepID=A0A9E2W7N8_9BACT|nr:hypothetical protein [Pinibacter aurantiacus]MBV4356986.1 hypothetical protein [Pinibacter aurantiacus]
MHVGLKMSYVRQSMNGVFYKHLYDKYIRFEPYAFNKSGKGKEWNAAKHPIMIDKFNFGEDLGILDKKGNIFSVGETGARTPYQSILIEQQSDIFFPTEAEIEETINYSAHFVSAYLYNGEYELVQSSVSETLFMSRGISQEILDTLKHVPYQLGILDYKNYDIRFNPGRMILMGHSWQMAAWKMWFGEPFFKLVPKEKLLAFPHAVEVKELPAGQVYVHLFDKVEESHTPESRFRQWEWQKWLDFDKLQELYP